MVESGRWNATGATTAIGALTAEALRVFRFAKPLEQLAVLTLSFVYGVLDLISLTMLVPLLIAAADLTSGGEGLIQALHAAFARLDLAPNAPLILGIVLLGLTLKATAGILLNRLVDHIVERTSSSAQVELVRGLIGARWDWFLHQRVGRLAHAVGAEAAAAGSAFRFLTDLLTSVVQVLAFVLIAAVLSWQFLIAIVVVASIASLLLWPLSARGRRTTRSARRQFRRQAGLFVDALSSLKAIRVMGRSDRFGEEIEAEIRAQAGQRRPWFDGDAAAELREPLVGALLAIGLYVAVSVLALPLHDLAIMAVLTIRALGSLLPMQRQWQRFVQNRRNLNALTGLLDACASNREAPFGNVRPSLDKAIRLEGIGFAFGKRTLLSGLEIEVPAGQITTLVGRSGIGKSTIVDLIVGLQQPSVGRVTVDGVDLATIDLAAWRRAIGYVPQEVVLLHDSLRRNVVFGTPDTSPASVAAAMEAAGASGFLADLPDGLDSSVGERGALLSGGQRQCIAIARALLLNPRLLILDEATTGLDPSTEAEICSRIHDLCRSRGLTVLAISHQPGWRRVADRVYRIEPGGTAALTSDPREAVA
jgi:ATP-binding cassette, subfamily C, bacterial